MVNNESVSVSAKSLFPFLLCTKYFAFRRKQKNTDWMVFFCWLGIAVPKFTLPKPSTDFLLILEERGRLLPSPDVA